MAFSLRLSKLSSGPAEILEIFADTEFLDNFDEIMCISKRRKMLNFVRRLRLRTCFEPND